MAARPNQPTYAPEAPMNPFSQYPVPSSTKGSTRVYNVQQYWNGEWTCACPNWTKNSPRQDCKHILLVKLKLKEMSPDALELALKKTGLKAEKPTNFGNHSATLKAGHWTCSRCKCDLKQMQNFPNCSFSNQKKTWADVWGAMKVQKDGSIGGSWEENAVGFPNGKVFMLPPNPYVVPETPIPEVTVQTIPTKTGRKFRK